MKIQLLFFLFFTVGVAHAQKATGVTFETDISWAQVQEKAKKENRYIFVDVFTTWCGPCKLMDKNVFPQEKAGEFFNAFFVNVKVQADVTKKDSELVRRWYKDAQNMVATYNVDSYPTYLFFNPRGELVHRINGASPTVEEFLPKAEVALSGYPMQKWQYVSGSKDPESLLRVMKSAQLMNDREFLPVVTNEYLATQKDLLTEENLKLIAASTRKTTDPGFPVLRHQADKADLVLGKGVSGRIVKTVVFDEIVLPHLKINGIKKDYGGMYEYIGKVNENVDWGKIEESLNLAFSDLSEDILITSKPMYYRWANNWPEFVSSVSSYRDRLNKKQLNNYANDVFLFCEDPESLEKALEWSKFLLDGEHKQDISFLSTYADLLYKTGKKEKAIKTMEEAVALSGVKESHLTETLGKMKSGKKTW